MELQDSAIGRCSIRESKSSPIQNLNTIELAAFFKQQTHTMGIFEQTKLLAKTADHETRDKKAISKILYGKFLHQ